MKESQENWCHPGCKEAFKNLRNYRVVQKMQENGHSADLPKQGTEPEGRWF